MKGMSGGVRWDGMREVAVKGMSRREKPACHRQEVGVEVWGGIGAAGMRVLRNDGSEHHVASSALDSGPNQLRGKWSSDLKHTSREHVKVISCWVSLTTSGKEEGTKLLSVWAGELSTFHTRLPSSSSSLVILFSRGNNQNSTCDHTWL